jgi:ABC-type glycerol-3-phosphate transport system substrate-binding protein
MAKRGKRGKARGKTRMNKKTIIGIAVGIGILALLAIVSYVGSPKSSDSTANTSSGQSAEKIEVVHFHGTHQCWSCVTVGEYALNTIKERFPEEYKNGTIVFIDINVELPINKDIVMKYKARSSSLFVNAITAGNDNIHEDATVWRLVGNEQQFVDYFEAELKKLLGKR